MEELNLARKTVGAREEAHHQGTQGDFAHPLATTTTPRPAEVVGRQWLEDNEWWGYRVDSRMLCMRGS